MGRELFVAASYFNHSCEPNCIIRRRGAFGFVSTLKAVEVPLPCFHRTPPLHHPAFASLLLCSLAHCSGCCVQVPSFHRLLLP